MITTVTFDAKTNLLTIIGEGIQPKQITIDEYDSWDCVNDLSGEPKYDIQLGYDEGYIQDIGHPFGFQYVNLVPTPEGNWEQGEDWNNAENFVLFNYEKSVEVKEDESSDYEVEICRTAYAHRTITVKAMNAEDAQALALDMSGEFDYSEADAEYTVTSISNI
jgi:hypothetical protein